MREDLLLTSGHPLIGTVDLLLKLAIVNKFGLPLPSGASRRTRAPTRYSRREAWLRSDVIRALLARAVPCFPAVLYVYRFLSVRLPWWRWVQPSRVSSLTASRSSFDCLASSTGAGTRESAHSQSNWCALNVCCRRGSAGSAHRCGPGRPTRQHLRYCSAADASMVGRHCEANNPASYASVVTVAVVWGASLALSLMPVRFPRLGQMPSGSPSSPTSAMEAGSRHMVESGVDRTQTDAFCFSSSRAVLQPSSAHRRPAPSV